MISRTAYQPLMGTAFFLLLALGSQIAGAQEPEKPDGYNQVCEETKVLINAGEIPSEKHILGVFEKALFAHNTWSEFTALEKLASIPVSDSLTEAVIKRIPSIGKQATKGSPDRTRFFVGHYLQRAKKWDIALPLLSSQPVVYRKRFSSFSIGTKHVTNNVDMCGGTGGGHN